jgi:hypothetical protein
MAKLLLNLGRVVGAVTSMIASACWAVAMWVPSAGLPLTGISFVVALLMLLLALFAAIASIHGHALVVVLVFLASFFPVGFALFTSDHWLAWIGRLDIGFLIAGVAMWAGARNARVASTPRADPL